MNTFAKNIDYLLHTNRMSANQLQEESAKKGIKIPQSTTTRILNSETLSPSTRTVRKYAEFFNIDESDIVYKDLTKTKREILTSSKPIDGTPISEMEYYNVEFWEGDVPLEDDEFEVPYYKDVEFRGGDGAFELPDEGRRRIKYANTAARNSGASKTDTFCTTLRGDSMEELIRDGSMIAVDRSKKEVREGKIYAFNHGGMLRVKYLIPRPHGALTIRSHNPAYQDEDLTAEQVKNDIEVIGWVWNWSSLERW